MITEFPFIKPKELKTTSIDRKKWKKYSSLWKQERKILTLMSGTSRRDIFHTSSELNSEGFLIFYLISIYLISVILFEIEDLSIKWKKIKNLLCLLFYSNNFTFFLSLDTHIVKYWFLRSPLTFHRNQKVFS